MQFNKFFVLFSFERQLFMALTLVFNHHILKAMTMTIVSGF
jgi:hypothetical protein